jgi:acyl dehydratase
MPLASSIVGTALEPVVHEVDARWTMAYAAGIGDELPCYLDTRRPDGVVAHPLFPVCLEWPAVLAGREVPAEDRLTFAERMRAVHATHDLLIHRLVRPGDRLTTRSAIAGVERRRPGAYQVTRLDTTDEAGAAVATTWMGALSRGVDVEGPDRPAEEPPLPAAERDAGGETVEIGVPIAATAAHVYTECARIWNPIHTDTAFAAMAGLPRIILHGTATLALAVSRVVELRAATDPARVRRIRARFGAMVSMPSEIRVCISTAVSAAAGDIVRFEVRDAEGDLAIGDGVAIVAPLAA